MHRTAPDHPGAFRPAVAVLVGLAVRVRALKGAGQIAGFWGRERGVVQVAFGPDFKRQRAAAPFRRNDAILRALPIGLVVFPGNGIQDNLADKARAAGVPVYDFRRERRRGA